MKELLYLSIGLFAGLLSTRISKRVGLPNVTGYLVAGLIIGPYCLNLIDIESVANLSIITNVALGFIAFSIGGEFYLDHIKKIGLKVVVITLFEALTAVFVVDVVLLILGYNSALAISLGAISAATAPAATIMVVRQYKAKGPLTSTLLPVVAMDDAVALMAYSISSQVAIMLLRGHNFNILNTIATPLINISMSLLIGAGLGVFIAFLNKFFHSSANRMCLSIFAVLIGLYIAKTLNLSDLLVCMSTGAVYVNLKKDIEKTLAKLTDFTVPIYMLFFVISGASLKFDVLMKVGAIGVLYIVCRVIGKYLGAYMGTALMKSEKQVRKYLGVTLIPQAGVAIGMAQLSLRNMPELGETIQAVVLSATLVYELVGPVCAKFALYKAGEIEKP